MKRPLQESENASMENPPTLDVDADDGSPLLAIPAELIDSLRRMLTRLGQQDRLPSRIALVAALRGEGVTTLSRALAATIANDLPLTVCVVELNMWWPAADGLAAGPDRGVAGVVTDDVGLNEAIVHTARANLSFLPAGRLSRQDRPVVARSESLKTMLDELSERFDHLILDIPAVLATSDAVPLAGLADGCVLVVRQGATSMEKVREALDELDHLQQLGVVLNRTRTDTPSFLLRFIPQA